MQRETTSFPLLGTSEFYHFLSQVFHLPRGTQIADFVLRRSTGTENVVFTSVNIQFKTQPLHHKYKSPSTLARDKRRSKKNRPRPGENNQPANFQPIPASDPRPNPVNLTSGSRDQPKLPVSSSFSPQSSASVPTAPTTSVSPPINNSTTNQLQSSISPSQTINSSHNETKSPLQPSIPTHNKFSALNMDDDESTDISGASTKRGRESSSPSNPSKQLKSTTTRLQTPPAPDFKNGAGNRPVCLQSATPDTDVSQAGVPITLLGDRLMGFYTPNGHKTKCNASYWQRVVDMKINDPANNFNCYSCYSNSDHQPGHHPLHLTPTQWDVLMGANVRSWPEDQQHLLFAQFFNREWVKH